jgi:hypothetical protein
MEPPAQSALAGCAAAHHPSRDPALAENEYGSIITPDDQGIGPALPLRVRQGALHFPRRIRAMKEPHGAACSPAGTLEYLDPRRVVRTRAGSEVELKLPGLPVTIRESSSAGHRECSAALSLPW